MAEYLTYAEDGEHGLPAIPHAWQGVGGGVLEVDSRDRTNTLGVIAKVGGMPVVWSGGRG